MSDDTSRSPSWARVIMGHVESQLDFVRVALPGRVDEYDAETQRAQVQPLVQHGEIIEGTRVTRTLPPNLDVPIMFPGSGAYRITWPIARGDIVLLVFSSSSISRWLAHQHDDRPVDPVEDRRHNLSDAIAIPGLYNFQNLPPAPGSDALVVHADAIKLGSDSASDPVALKSDLQALKTAIENAAVVANDGGESLRTTLLEALDGWPVGSSKVRAE